MFEALNLTKHNGNMKYGILLIVNIIIVRIYGQEKNITYSNQQWIQYYNQTQLNEKWAILADVGIRRQNKLQDWSQALVRGGVSYTLNSTLQLAGGIAYFTSFKNNERVAEEKRCWEEFSLKQTVFRFSIQHRFRLEERYFFTFSTKERSFNYRMRYRFYFTVPLNHSSLTDKTLYFLGGDEIFLNFGKKVIYNMYDQNRVLAGLGYKFNDLFQISLTYVYQYAQKNKPLSFEETGIVWLAISHKIRVDK